MPLYESTFITRQDMSRQEITKLTDSVTSTIEEHGGKVVKNEYWGLRNLAYRINKSRKGHYAMLGIDAPAGAIAEMQRKARINEDVMRNLVIRVEEIEEGPSSIVQQSRPREESAPRIPHEDTAVKASDATNKATEKVTEDTKPAEEKADKAE